MDLKERSNVDYVHGEGIVYKSRKSFAENLEKLPKPLPEIIESLIKFKNARLTFNENHLYDTFARFLEENSSEYLWSLLHWVACLGEELVMDMVSQELATRVNNQIKNGIVAVQVELGIGA